MFRNALDRGRSDITNREGLQIVMNGAEVDCDQRTTEQLTNETLRVPAFHCKIRALQSGSVTIHVVTTSTN